MKVVEIPIDKIEQNENSRVIYKTSDLGELMQSMKKDGQLQPVGVRELPGGKYDAVFGNRRIIAAKKLGWATISANILEIEDAKERDILNLLENLKRQNTTVSEDGRMFCVLRDYGLSIDEVAARLDISRERVETAIDVYSHVPREFHAKILNRTTGKKIKGTISASAAHTIMGLRRKHGLKRKQMREMLSFAAEDGSSLQHIQKVAPLVASGHSVSGAIRISGSLRRVTLYLFMDEDKSEKLEKKHGKSLSELLLMQIKKNPEFKIYEDEKGSAHYTQKARQHRPSGAKHLND